MLSKVKKISRKHEWEYVGGNKTEYGLSNGNPKWCSEYCIHCGLVKILTLTGKTSYYLMNDELVGKRPKCIIRKIN